MTAVIERCIDEGLREPTVVLMREQIHEEWEKVTRELEELEAKKENAFGFERGAEPRLDRMIANRRSFQKRLELWAQFGVVPQLDLAPLTWRNDEGWPSLVLMPIGVHYFRIIAEVHGNDLHSGFFCGRKWDKGCGPRIHFFDINYGRSIPPVAQEKYEDITQRLSDMARKERKTCELTTQYTSLLPESVKEKAEAARISGHDLYILAEAKNWNLSKQAPTPQDDPLLLVWDGEVFSVLDKFNLTSTEEYVGREFTF